ncbi:MAG: fatty acid desaturase [Bdellovibrionales bacterium]|nr:fatty acid desaturase [Bdellovibrionales bacterium]
MLFKKPLKITGINWPGALFLTLTPPAAIVLTTIHLMREGFVWQIWLMAAVFYSMTASSITGGYHRYFAHRTYEARPWLKWYWSLFGAMAFQNSIFIWARDHRVHHRFVDTDSDPYSINKGFFYAHFGWMLILEEPTVDMGPYGRDLERDKIVMFQHKHYVLIASLMCFALPTLLGWMMGSWLGGLAIAGFLRLVVLHHMTFFVNSWCHYFGRQTYTDTNTAKDSFLMAVATFGEGYHNFHHIFANDYRNGIRWYHWDPTKWMIQLFRLMGGAYNLRITPQNDIIRMQLQMDERRLKTRLQPDWHDQLEARITELKTQVEAAHVRWEKLREEYKKLAADYAEDARHRLDELKEQLRLARSEFKAALRQWREFNSTMMMQPVRA